MSSYTRPVTQPPRSLMRGAFAVMLFTATGCASGAVPREVPGVEPALSGATVRGVPDVVTDTAALLAGLEDAARRPALEVITGSASYYSDVFIGRLTASGEPYDATDLVAAHPNLPFGTILRVTNLTNEQVVVVRVVDRGPFAYGRVLDLSRRAAETLDMIQAGHAPVRIEVLRYGG